MSLVNARECSGLIIWQPGDSSLCYFTSAPITDSDALPTRLGACFLVKSLHSLRALSALPEQSLHSLGGGMSLRSQSIFKTSLPIMIFISTGDRNKHANGSLQNSAHAGNKKLFIHTHMGRCYRRLALRILQCCTHWRWSVLIPCPPLQGSSTPGRCPGSCASGCGQC